MFKSKGIKKIQLARTTLAHNHGHEPSVPDDQGIRMHVPMVTLEMRV